jgi:hypothetical protein
MVRLLVGQVIRELQCNVLKNMTSSTPKHMMCPAWENNNVAFRDRKADAFLRYLS